MSLRIYFGFMLVADLLAWVGWGFIVNNIDPGTSGTAFVALFYLSLFLALLGLFTMVGLAGRIYLHHETAAAHWPVRRAFRQSAWLACLVNAALFLSSHNWLRWWVLLILVAVVATWEIFFLFGEKTTS